MATAPTKDDLLREAALKLACYLSLPLEGFRWQAFDRARAAGLDVEGLPAGRAGAEALLETLRGLGYGS